MYKNYVSKHFVEEFIHKTSLPHIEYLDDSRQALNSAEFIALCLIDTIRETPKTEWTDNKKMKLINQVMDDMKRTRLLYALVVKSTKECRGLNKNAS